MGGLNYEFIEKFVTSTFRLFKMTQIIIYIDPTTSTILTRSQPTTSIEEIFALTKIYGFLLPKITSEGFITI